MKIAFIARFNPQDEEPIAQAFEKEGVQIVRLEENQKNSVYLEQIRAEKPDLVLFMKLRVENPEQLIKDIKAMGIKTASWTFDLLIGHPTREFMISAFYWLDADYVFLTDGGHDYAGRVKNKFTLRQGIVEEFNYIAKPEKASKNTHEIVFVGSYASRFAYRQKVMSFLEKTYGERFHWYGKDDTYEVRGHELNKLCASAKIVIGCSMPSPNYWSNRLYETIGRGGFTIFPKIEGLEKEFEYDKEIVVYEPGNFGELKEKIDYYLENEEERKQIALNGFNRTKKEYTFNHRVRKFLNIWASL